MAVVVGTWPFSLAAVQVISDKLRDGWKCIDALESGINVIEEDPSTGCYFVGRGGLPNAQGVLECDAGVMVGERCQFGAVAALQGIATPFSIARRVMEKSPHSMLVGEGARDFAINNEFAVESNVSLQTPESRKAYKEFIAKQEHKTGSHDTLGILVLDSDKHLVSGVSSSGRAFKHPGRVGDSPLPGSGLYADDETGAAAATGDGDQMMRFCPSFHVVKLMSEGYSPQDACEKVVREAQRKAGTALPSEPFEMALIALSKKGEVGAAGTVRCFEDSRDNKTYPGFPFVVWTNQMNSPEIRVQPPVSL